MPTVSLSFLIMISAVAAASGVLSLVAPNPVYDMAALLLALHAVHGLGLRIALREQGGPQEIRRQFENLREELEQERSRLEVERAERSALEQQWIGLPAGEERAGRVVPLRSLQEAALPGGRTIFIPFKTLWADESGQDLVEYALLVALIAIIVIASLAILGPIIATVFNNISSNLGAVGGEGTCCD